MTYQWKFNGNDISGATGDTLFLPSVSLASEGSYSVVVTNAQGSTTSSAGILTINGGPEVVEWGNSSLGQTAVPNGLSHVVAMATGVNHSLALKSDGTVVAWGDNTLGQTDVPAGLTNVATIAAGRYHTLALKADGTVIGWGYNGNGQTNIPAGLTNVVAIAAGYYHTLALKADGTVIGWGDNSNGQTDVPVGLNTVVAIAAGGDYSLALKADGTVIAWGNYDFPVPDGLNNVIAIAEGTSHRVALKSDGTVVSWGYDGLGETAVPSGLNNVVAIAAGDDHTLALKKDGTVIGWGSNNFRQIFIDPVNAGNAAAIAAGGSCSMELLATEARVAKPVILNSPFAEAGLDAPLNYQVTAKNHPVSYDATGLPAGLTIDTHTGLITGTPTAAGNFAATVSATNASGTAQANLAFTVNIPVPNISSGTFPIAGTGSSFFYQVTATNAPASFHATGLPAGLTLNPDTGLISGSTTAVGSHTVSLFAQNGYGAGATTSLILKVQNVVVWGDGSSGQKDGPGDSSTVVSVASGYNHLLALHADGTVEGWGSNGYDEATIPFGLSAVAAIAAGDGHSLALKTDGTVIAWGANYSDQTTIPAGLNHVVAVAAGGAHSLALKSDGTVVAWGDNYLGSDAIPSGLSNVVGIASGYYFNLALKADGSVVGWGDNYYGQTTIPVGLNNVLAIAAGDFHSLALKTDGTVIGWGYNGNGQADAPAGLTNVVAISAAGYHSLALKSDGTVVAWGDGYYGDLTVPESMSHIISITAGGSQSAVLTAINVSAPQSVILNSPFAMAGYNSNFSFRVAALNSPTSYGASGLPFGVSIDPSTGLISGAPLGVGTFPVTLSATNTSGTSQKAINLTVLNTAGLNATQIWRTNHFGITTNTGNAADTADPDLDGMINLLEFSTNLNPTIASTAPGQVTRDGGNLVFTYTRSKTAVSEGVTFTVEWSDDLTPLSWSTAGVTTSILSEDSTVQNMQALIPVGSGSTRFVHLKVTR